jgi:predicted membrane channel-forming protein YqfA (hemolysin III family)
MISLIIAIALVGLIVYLITTYVPMPAPFKTIIYVICVIFLIIYLMRVLNIADIPLTR